MAKKHFVAYSNMTKKQKVLNFLKILGFSLAGIAAVVGGVVLYIWGTGQLIPGPVELQEMYFASAEVDENGNRKSINEYVIDGNKEIAIGPDNEQLKDENGNLVWIQKTDENGKPVYESIFVEPSNKEATELDAVLTIDTPTSPMILQVVTDENCSPVASSKIGGSEQTAVNLGDNENGDEAVENNEEADPNALYYAFNVKIGSPIYLRPLTTEVEINGGIVTRNIGGWTKITITQGQKFKSCWVYVDDPVLEFNIELDESKFKKDESYDETNDWYNIYANSDLNINEIFAPENSLVLPKTNIPYDKMDADEKTHGYTSFLKEKTIRYYILPDKIATIDTNGKITINPEIKTGQFTIQAEIIAKYNNIGKEPDINNYGGPSQDSIVPYTRDYDKIRVWSNVITFNINEITVNEIQVSKPTEQPSFDVFEDGLITLHNNKTAGSTRNSYYVNLVLTDDDEAYKTTLLSRVKMFVGYAGDFVDEKPVAKSTDEFVIYDEDIGRYRQLVDASLYVTLERQENGSYNYIINRYSDNKFYFIFYYERFDNNDGEETINSILYESVKFNLKQNDVNKIEVLSKENGDTISLIKLNYNSDDDRKTYNISDKLNIKLTGKDSAVEPTYTYVMYFTPVEGALISTYDGEDGVKAMIEGKECALIAAKTGDVYDFTKIVPINNGTTKIYVAVVKTTERYVGQDVVELWVSEDNFVEIERQASVTLEIKTAVTFTSISYDEGNSKNIERAVTELDVDDPEFSFAGDCQLFAEVYEEGRVEVVLSYVGDDDAVKNNRVQILILSGSEAIAKDSLSIQGEDGIYSFTINALSAGYAKFQVLYDDGHGAEYKIGIKVLSIQLVGVSLETEKVDLNVAFTGEQGSVECNWEELDIDIYYNSPKTESKSFELKTYALPELFKDEEFLANFGNDGDSINSKLQTLLSLYYGKTDNEVINNDILIENDIETIKKLVAKLTIDDSVLKIFNTSEVDESLVDADVMICDVAEGEESITNYKYKVNALDRVLIIAQAGDILSNPILIETKCPEIKVMQGENEITSVSRTVYAHGTLNSIDGHQTAAYEENMFGGSNDYLNFIAIIDGEEYIINDLIKFKFKEQTEENGMFISDISNATIFNGVGAAIFTTSDINKTEIEEKIIIYSDFGYINSDLLKYTIISDYKLVVTKDTTYKTPTNVNLFAGTNDSFPHMIVTNVEYNLFVKTLDTEIVFGKNYYEIRNNAYRLVEFPDYAEIDNYYEITGAKAPNKLYLPKAFNGNLNTLFPADFLACFTYADNEESEAYAHIYKVLRISADGNNGENYIPSGNSGMITLQYKTKQSISFSVRTDGSQLLATSIKVEPGVSANFGNGYSINTADSVAPVSFIDKIKFNKEPNFEVYITNIDFSVTDKTSDDLTFYYVSDTEKRVETFVQVLPENVEYVLEAEAGYKYYFIKSTDVSAIDPDKTYYQLNENNEFVVVAEPNIQGLEDDIYFEKVYSNKTYYTEETYYKAIPSEELNEAYLLKYYEAVYDDNEQLIGYQKTNDREINTEKTYFYKLNYKEIEEGSDITNVFDKLTIVLNIQAIDDGEGNVTVTAVEIDYNNAIENIVDSIKFVLSIEARIVNTINEAETNPYNGLYFNVSLI